MDATSLLYPVFAQVALTFIMLIWMGNARLRALRRGETSLRDIALGEKEAWPPRVRTVANSYHNQFELPVLFYVLCIFAVLTKAITPLLVTLAWAYIVTRIAHVAVYTTSNNVHQRFTIFVIGMLILIAMWVLFGWQLFGSPGNAV